INGQTSYVHKGDRTVYRIIEFVKRAHGPAVKKLLNGEHLTKIKSDRNGQSFFVYFGQSSPLKEIISLIGSENTSSGIIVVFKDDGATLYSGSSYDILPPTFTFA
ncbi:unnamed protein product, partial [Protopolystoma xenopodis]